MGPSLAPAPPFLLQGLVLLLLVMLEMMIELLERLTQQQGVAFASFLIFFG